MKIISHRGNLRGPNETTENTPEAIVNALNRGFDVEIDLHVVNGRFYLGHDDPQHIIDETFLENSGLWIHCKNREALEYMASTTGKSYFWHQEDDFTLTSNGKIWCHCRCEPMSHYNAICVLPEKTNPEIKLCYGVCTDYPYFYLK